MRALAVVPVMAARAVGPVTAARAVVPVTAVQVVDLEMVLREAVPETAA